MDWRHLGELLDAGAGGILELKNICVWVLDQRREWARSTAASTKLALVFKHGRKKHRNNIELGLSRPLPHECLELSWRQHSLGRTNEEGNSLALPPNR